MLFAKHEGSPKLAHQRCTGKRRFLCSCIIPHISFSLPAMYGQPASDGCGHCNALILLARIQKLLCDGMVEGKASVPLFDGLS